MKSNEAGGPGYRVDALRSQVAAQFQAAGLEPTRAAAMATHLLWHDMAGLAEHGVGTLEGWLGRIRSGEVDAAAVGKVLRPEYAGTAIFDAGNGLAPLVLARAAGIAVEKARDTGIAVVRVENVEACGPLAEVAAEVAIGPYLACLVGPEARLTLAFPTAEGLPAVFDSRLVGPGEPAAAAPSWMAALGPWVSALVRARGYLVVVLTIPAIESLDAFQQRLPSDGVEEPGWLLPGPWEARRSRAREFGLSLAASTVAALERAAAGTGRGAVDR